MPRACPAYMAELFWAAEPAASAGAMPINLSLLSRAGGKAVQPPWREHHPNDQPASGQVQWPEQQPRRNQSAATLADSPSAKPVYLVAG